MSIFSKSRKKKERNYRNKKMNTFNAINAKYELGITYDEFYPIAKKWAQDKAKASGGFFSKLFSSGFKGLFSLVVSVVSVIVTWGASLALNAASLAASLANIANTAYGIYAQSKLLNLSMRLSSLASSLESLKNLRASEQRSAQLTQSLIYNPYEIFANGAIYKQRGAGNRNKWSSSLPPDCNAGILGEVRTDSFDEQLSNRAHIEKAGNSEFFNSQLNAPFPLSKGGISYAQIHDGIKNHFAIDQKRINEGFLELNKQDFNYIGTAQKIYNRVYDAQLVPHFIRLQNEDFLEKIKNYQKALCAEFDYLWKQKLDPREQQNQTKATADEIRAYLKAQAENQAQDKEPKELAKEYHQSVLYIQAVLEQYTPSFYSFARAPFVLEFPNSLAERQKGFLLETCTNKSEYYQNPSGYLQAKESLFAALFATKTQREFEKALNLFNSLAPTPNPNFQARWRSQLQENQTSGVDFYSKLTQSQVRAQALDCGKGLRAEFMLYQTSYKLDSDGGFKSITNFITPSKTTQFPLEKGLNPKATIEQYKRFVQDCFVEQLLGILEEKNGKTIQSKHNYFYVGHFAKEPYVRFAPLPKEIYDFLASPLPQSPKIENFDWEELHL